MVHDDTESVGQERRRGMGGSQRKVSGRKRRRGEARAFSRRAFSAEEHKEPMGDGRMQQSHHASEGLPINTAAGHLVVRPARSFRVGQQRAALFCALGTLGTGGVGRANSEGSTAILHEKKQQRRKQRRHTSGSRREVRVHVCVQRLPQCMGGGTGMSALCWQTESCVTVPRGACSAERGKVTPYRVRAAKEKKFSKVY